MFKASEAHGKYRTRYRTAAAIGIRTGVQHEHVWTRKALAARIFAGEDVADVLGDAVACVVLKSEHDTLSAFDRDHPDVDGWERDRGAGLTVIELATGEPYAS